MIVLTVAPEAVAADVLTQVKLAALRFPGRERLQVVVLSPRQGGDRRAVRLGRRWSYDASEACLAALHEFGQVEVIR